MVAEIKSCKHLTNQKSSFLQAPPPKFQGILGLNLIRFFPLQWQYTEYLQRFLVLGESYCGGNVALLIFSRDFPFSSSTMAQTKKLNSEAESSNFEFWVKNDVPWIQFRPWPMLWNHSEYIWRSLRKVPVVVMRHFCYLERLSILFILNDTDRNSDRELWLWILAVPSASLCHLLRLFKSLKEPKCFCCVRHDPSASESLPQTLPLLSVAVLLSTEFSFEFTKWHRSLRRRRPNTSDSDLF